MLAVAVLLLTAIAVKIFRANAPKKADDLLEYFKKHPDRVSFCMAENDCPIIAYQADRKMPLASVLKIMVAIEYIRQVKSRQITPDQTVTLDQLDRYYIPYSDGGAHQHWLEGIHRRQPQPGQPKPGQTVTLAEVAKGMIEYSSNANTEYLMAVLGLEAINRTVLQIGGADHDPIFPISSAGLMGTYLMDTESMTFREMIRRLERMSFDEYASISKEILQKLSEDGRKAFIRRYGNRMSFHRELQLVSSRRMPAGTARLYATLPARLRQLDWFDDDAWRQFRHLMQRPVREGSPIAELLSKGGSSISICNDVLYAKDREGNRLSIAMFIQEPSRKQLKRLQRKTVPFVLKLLLDPDYRSRVARELAGNGWAEPTIRKEEPRC